MALLRVHPEELTTEDSEGLRGVRKASPLSPSASSVVSIPLVG